MHQIESPRLPSILQTCLKRYLKARPFWAVVSALAVHVALFFLHVCGTTCRTGIGLDALSPEPGVTTTSAADLVEFYILYTGIGYHISVPLKINTSNSI
jgi:hypothetical protein